MNAFIRSLQQGLPCALALLVLAGCAVPRPTGFIAVEEQLPTRGGIVGEAGMFHDVVYNPESVALSFPGYIIGIDKARRHHVADAAELAGFTREQDTDEWGMTLFNRRLARDPKLHYISHIVRSEGRPFGDGNCVLFTIYRNWGQPGRASGFGITPNPDPDLDEKAGCNGAAPSYGEIGHAFEGSRRALEELRKDIARSRDAYTHALVVVMGWNTPQIEAVRNYNAIASHIRRAAAAEGREFRPLFIGVTWSSTWSSQWVDAAVKVFSYPAKADDADEVGLTWLGEVLEEVRRTVPAELPTVAIGHSFGARSLASALCKGSQVRRAGQAAPQRAWDLFIGWQPAFSIFRFAQGGSADGFRYGDGCPGVRSLLFTASEHDQAVDSNFWADFIGADDSWKTACVAGSRRSSSLALPKQREIHCLEAARVQNAASYDLDLQVGKINYLDGSRVVWFNQPNTGGGAHSDVYRPVHGRISWHAISRLAGPGGRLAAAESAPR